MSGDDVQEIKESIHRVHDRLNEISKQLSATVAVLSVHVDTLQRHDECLNGDNGLRIRTTRVEGTLCAVTWGIRAVWGAIVSIAAVVAGKLFGV